MATKRLTPDEWTLLRAALDNYQLSLEDQAELLRDATGRDGKRARELAEVKRDKFQRIADFVTHQLRPQQG